jgi:hypothetical protein
MRQDADPLVRELVEERLSAALSSPDGEHAVIEMKPAQLDGRRH